MKEIIVQLITAMFGSLGFSLIFNVGKRYLLPASIGGLLSWIVYLLCVNLLSMDLMTATIVSAACCQIYAEMFARIMKCPTTVFYIPAVVPLIPGGSLYHTMYAAVYRNWDQFQSYGLQTLQVTLGIAVGISFVSGILYIMTNSARRRAMNTK